jgi:DNA-binding SARP family transcriptional activator
LGTSDPIRVYLAGTLFIERGTTLVDERRFPGRQGRLAFAMLAAERDRALSKEELADELWGDGLPRAWEVALRALVSKLRGVLAEVDLDGQTALPHAFGCYQLRLPTDAWVDLEAAADAIHRAETALRDGDLATANGWALPASQIARRPLLPGEQGTWVYRRRAQLAEIRVRALECRAAVLLEGGDPRLAARDAQEVVDLEPFRETGYRLLMRAHAAAGNPAEALRVFERCRATIVAELGADPSAETQELYLEILRAR